jgi:hypothetical protein
MLCDGGIIFTLTKDSGHSGLAQALTKLADIGVPALQNYI